MSNTEILNLIRVAMDVACKNVPLSVDFEFLYELAKKHQIENLLFYGMEKCGIKGEGEKWDSFYNAVCKNIYISEIQQYESQRIFAAFEENGIEYMPLKGVLLKSIYEKADMRTMSDLDILIKEVEYLRISKVMRSLGYTEVRESDHELVWTNERFVCVELHKRLIPSYNKDYNAFFGDGWKFAHKSGESQLHRMNAEDEFVYIFTHFAKHYRDSGVGIKQLLDLWVYKEKNPNIDKEYVISCLKELNLDVFYANICSVLGVWMGCKEHTETTEKITDFIFDSGVYGTSQNMIMSGEIKDKSLEKKRGRLCLLARKVFKPLAFMKKRYPVLKHIPILLPFMWFVRLFDALINKKERVSDLFIRLSPKEIAQYKKELESVGLSYNFDT